MFDEEKGSQAGEFLSALRRRWQLVAALVVVAAAAALAFTATAAERYRAEADILITPFEDSTEAFSGITLFRDETSSVYAAGRIMTTPPVTEGVIRRLDLALSREELLEQVSIRPLEQSSIVTITAEAGSAAGAAELANTFADVFIDRRRREFQQQLEAAIERVEARLDALTPSVPPAEPASTGAQATLENQLGVLQAQLGARDPTIGLLSRAVPPDSPSWPRPALTLFVAILAALILGVGAVLVLEALDPRMSSEDALLRRLPVFARIPRAPSGVARDYLRGKGHLPANLWEGYRTLRASLTARGIPGDSPRAVLVTSAIKAEGKTMTSVNLAKALTAGGLRVILVDGDFRRPAVGSAFGLSRETGGLADLLFGHGSVDDSLVDAPGYGNWLRLLLPGGAQPIDLWEPRRIAELIGRLKNEADVVVVDSPPLTEFADAFAVVDAVDTVLVAVRLGHSRRDRFAELNRFLSQHDVAPAGLVVTSRRRSRDAGLAPTIEAADILLFHADAASTRTSGTAAKADR